MAIKLFKVDNFHYGIHQEFFIDSEDDLEQIEVEYNCELGDKAYLPSGEVYIRHSDGYSGDKWIIEGSGGSESSLPTVTTDDNGDVLTVIDGTWAKAAPNGGLSGLLITVTLNTTDNTFALDKTYAEISTAIESGVCPVVKLTNEYGTFIGNIPWYFYDSESAVLAYKVSVSMDGQALEFSADTATDVLMTLRTL